MEKITLTVWRDLNVWTVEHSRGDELPESYTHHPTLLTCMNLAGGYRQDAIVRIVPASMGRAEWMRRKAK